MSILLYPIPFSLNPSDWTDLMLKPCVGVTWWVSSAANCFRMVVFPALSSPSSKMRSSRSGVDFNFLKMESSPMIGVEDVRKRPDNNSPQLTVDEAFAVEVESPGGKKDT